MLEAIRNDCRDRFGATESADNMNIMLAYSGTDLCEANAWKEEVQAIYPNHTLMCDPLSLSVSCHIGDGALAIACSKKMPEELLHRYE
jgi:hypothetical protein